MKTTPEQFEKFRKECVRLQKVLNLQNWDLYIEHRLIPPIKNEYTVALCDAETISGNATITLNADSGDSTPVNPVEAARHEMGHLFLWELTEVAIKKMTQKEAKIIEKLEKDIVCVMEKLKITCDPSNTHAGNPGSSK